MQLPVTTKRGQTKPWGSTIPRINWAHPLAQHLTLYCYDTGGGLVVDLVSGSAMTSMGTQSPNKTSVFGSGRKYPDNTVNSGMALASSPTVEAVQPPFSFATGYLQTGTNTNNFPTIFARAANNGASDPYHNWEIQATATANQVRAAWNLSSTEFDTGAYAINYNVYNCVACVLTPGVNYNLYVNGVSKETGTNNWANDNTQDNIHIGNNPGTSGAFPGYVYWGGLWARALSSAETLQLYNDPYCFLIYPEDEIFAQGVGSTGSSGSVGLVTGSGSATGIGGSTATSTASASGVGTASAVGASNFAAVGSSSGTGTATGVGISTAASVASATGAGSASGVALSTAASVFTSSGTGTATGVGTSTGGGSAATSVGSGTASGVGISTAASVASSTGAGIATGVATSIAAATATSSGSGIASAVGLGSTASVGSSGGSGTAAGVATSIAAAVANANGSGVATGFAGGVASTGNASGVGTASGVSAVTLSAVGTASGASTAQAFTDNLSIFGGRQNWRWRGVGQREYKPQPNHSEQVKKAAAVLSKMGGHARAASLTAKQRTNIASNAAKVRWK